MSERYKSLINRSDFCYDCWNDAGWAMATMNFLPGLYSEDEHARDRYAEYDQRRARCFHTSEKETA